MKIATARNAVCYFLRKQGLSTNMIGRAINRDHTTVIANSRRFGDLLFIKDPLAVKIKKAYEEEFLYNK